MQACVGKRSHSRPEAAVLRKACLQGWPLAGVQELGLYKTPETDVKHLLTYNVVLLCPGCLHKKCDLW